jgi:hypothetical protein
VAHSNFIWHRRVPVKVSIMAWCLLCNRLPTKSNMLARGIISHEAQRYVTGCGEVETVQHLFVSCPIFSDVWPLVQQWIGVYGVDPLDIHQHFIQFIYLSGRSTKRRTFMQLLWLLCVWVIWSERNSFILVDEGCQRCLCFRCS